MRTRKYKQIVSSIHEIGLIEPLAVIQPDASKSEYILLDGHLRVLAFKELGLTEVSCLFAKDDESYSYNHQINRLSTIQEHYMIRRAIDRGVSKERLARAFNVNLSSINRRVNLLSGICPGRRVLSAEVRVLSHTRRATPAILNSNPLHKREPSCACG